jgi:hypothetical protein
MKKSILKSIFGLILFAFFLGCSSDSDTSCVPVTCLNGGTSTEDCGCDCPAGYTGTNCAIQVTPTKILITKIRVTKFPNFDGTSSWDVLGGNPDIYLKLIKDTSPIYISGYYLDALSTGTNFYDFIPTTPIAITDVNAPYILNLFDYDGADTPASSDDNMGYMGFFLYSSTNGFPSTISIGSSADVLRFELTVSYEW